MAPVEESASVPAHAVGLVLSGGGTRGIAHVGVLRALAEEGIFPGCVAGASSGALVGALYAAGYPTEEMLAFFDRKNPFRLSKVAITKPGIIDTTKIVGDFEDYFPDDSFEALDKELHVVATDLTGGQAVRFDSGPLIEPLLASCSVPLMFTPIEAGKRVMADGGIVDNFPTDLVRERCRTLIGVHASPIHRLEPDELHNALSVLRRALDVGMFHASEAKFAACDVLIQPSGLDRFGMFDTKHFEEIESAGYAAAVEAMPAIRRALQTHPVD